MWGKRRRKKCTKPEGSEEIRIAFALLSSCDGEVKMRRSAEAAVRKKMHVRAAKKEGGYLEKKSGNGFFIKFCFLNRFHDAQSIAI